MSREILFKAKRKNWRKLPKEEGWVEGYVIRDDITGQAFIHAQGNSVNESQRIGEEGCLRFFAYEIDHETLCKYTGRIDKNGKRIWENSVVKTSTGIVGKVIWHDETAGFCLLPENENDDFLLLSYWIEEYEIEVISNIFDNPELL